MMNSSGADGRGSVELSGIHTSLDHGSGSGSGDDDYLNAIMGRNSYNPPSGVGGNNDQSNHSYGNDPNNRDKLSKPLVKSGIGGASANLVNSIVGAGIIGIPYALRQSGLIAGLFLLLLVAYLTDKSLRIIVGLAAFHPQLKNLDVRTFEALASYPFGRLGSNFILLNMFVLAYGAMVAYLLIIKDTIPSVLGVESGVSKVLIMLATSITIMVPLSMQRDMASLAITSLVSVLADVVLVGFITAFSPYQESIENAGGFGQILVTDSINPTLFIGLGILSTAMACQHSAFIVSGSLENRTMTRWSKVTGVSITLSAILCMVLGVFGYLGFLGETEGDVLNNFDDDSTVANAARILLAITMFFTYPMECFVARHVMVQLWHGGDLDGRDDPNHSGADGDEAGGYWVMNRRQTWTMGIYLLAVLPALVVDDLGPVLSITGSLGGGCIAYMAPGLCYLGVFGGEFLTYANNLLRRRQQEGSSSITEADLPVDGDASQVMTIQIDEGRKPVWWYIAGFPIWCYIASLGRTNMNSKISRESNMDPRTAPPQDVSDEDGDVIIPNGTEFTIAIFFVIFGVVAVFAGVGSNIYMIVNGIVANE